MYLIRYLNLIKVLKVRGLLPTLGTIHLSICWFQQDCIYFACIPAILEGMELEQEEEDMELEQVLEVGMLHIRIANLHTELEELRVKCNSNSQGWD